MGRRPRYDDFEIVLRSVAGGEYEAQVVKSPFGQAPKSPFLVPFGEAERRALLSKLRWRVPQSSPAGRDLVRAQAPEPNSDELSERAIGLRLFESLLSGAVRDLYQRSIAQVRDRRGSTPSRLRLRLSFDPGEDFSSIATLPWELLCGDGDYLTRDVRLSVVRSLTIGHAPDPQRVRSRLRVLVIEASPVNCKPVDASGELACIREALQTRQDVEVDVVRNADIRDLRRALKEKPYHIVHFIGHGGMAGEGGDRFALYFEGPARQAEAVTGDLVAEFLKDLQAVRLVVLNSCWGGALPVEGSQDPFAGVAVSLVRREIPATVAMQFPITDRAAIAFSDGFYKSLAAGEPVEEAVTEGRLAILADHQSSLEWLTPALFLPGDGRLFELRKPSVRSRPSAEKKPSPLPEEEPLRLAVRSFHKPHISIERPDYVLDLTPFFGPRRPHEPRSWHDELFPRLRDFLRGHQTAGRPIELDFAAHWSLAFAAGYVLEAKSGLDIEVWQRGMDGKPKRWHAEAGPARQAPLWRDEPDVPLDGSAAAVAMAVGVTWPVLGDVEAYLRRAAVPVRRIVPMTLSPQPGPMGVEDGLHALQLAQDLAYRIRLRSAEERAEPLHLFLSAPNVVPFFLGQLGKFLGPIQLYEHDPHPEPGADVYYPSLRLPPLSAPP